MNWIWRRVGPWATPLLAVIEVILVTSGVLAVRTAVIVGVVIETTFWVTALSRTTAAVRRFRSERTKGLDGWVAAEDALAQVVPRSVARVLLIEPRLLSCLVRWSTGRHEGRAPGAFSYHRGLRPLLVTIVALVAGEGAVVETLLALLVPGSPWVWVALGVHAYALVWLIGFLASLVTRPHRIGPDALFVRDGIFSELQIPYGAIVGVRIPRHANFGRSGLKVDPAWATVILAMGDANVELDLDPTAEIHRSGASTPLCLRTLYITVDDPPIFVRDLHVRCVGQEGASQSVAGVPESGRAGGYLQQWRRADGHSAPWALGDRATKTLVALLPNDREQSVNSLLPILHTASRSQRWRDAGSR